MKKVFFLFVAMSVSLLVTAQDTHFPYYHQRTTLFDLLPTSPDDIIFIGNSISNGGEWFELFNNKNMKNRGINGDTALGVYDRLDQILKGKPAKIFLLIGTNDMALGVSNKEVIERVKRIVEKIKADAPDTRLYLQNLFPTNDHYNLFTGHTHRWKEIPKINKGLKALAKKEKVAYIDLFSQFKEKDSDKLDLQYSNDGLHLMGSGYQKWVNILKPYIEE